MSYLIGGGSIYIEGQPAAEHRQPPASFMNHVGHDYFETMGIPIVRGRAFTEDDEREHATTRRFAIVNESMAAKYWPGEDPIGKRFRAFNLTEPLLEVVGVARDSKYVVVFEAPRPYVYLPLERDLSLRTLHVRASGDPAALAPRLEREIQATRAGPADRGSADDEPVAGGDLRLSDLPGRRDSGGRHGPARPDARDRRRLRRRRRSAPACGRARSASASRSARSRATCCA